MKQNLTLAQLQAQGQHDPIWVLNTSSRVEGVDETSEVVIPIRLRNGSNTALTIPHTWAPVELTSQVPREDLLAAHTFRDAIRKNLIQPVTTEWAMNELADKETQVELKRLDKKARKVARAASSLSEDDSETVVAKTSETVKPKVAQSFMNWVSRVSQMPETQILNEMKLRNKFSLAELRYLLKEVAHHSIVRAQIEGRIAKRKAARRAKKA